MYKACSRCGKIHSKYYRCNYGIDRSKYYKGNEEDKLRATNDWKNKSIQIREDSNYLCAICFDKGIYNYNNVEVHHIVKLKDNKSLLLDDDNLICLCKQHHIQADNGEISKEYLYELVRKRNEKG